MASLYSSFRFTLPKLSQDTLERISDPSLMISDNKMIPIYVFSLEHNRSIITNNRYNEMYSSYKDLQDKQNERGLLYITNQSNLPQIYNLDGQFMTGYYLSMYIRHVAGNGDYQSIFITEDNFSKGSEFYKSKYEIKSRGDDVYIFDNIPSKTTEQVWFSINTFLQFTNEMNETNETNETKNYILCMRYTLEQEYSIQVLSYLLLLSMIFEDITIFSIPWEQEKEYYIVAKGYRKLSTETIKNIDRFTRLHSGYLSSYCFFKRDIFNSAEIIIHLDNVISTLEKCFAYVEHIDNITANKLWLSHIMSGDD